MGKPLQVIFTKAESGHAKMLYRPKSCLYSKTAILVQLQAQNSEYIPKHVATVVSFAELIDISHSQ